ncbi:MAG: hypothetical protein Kow0042_24770 [Calditrichia bacterium]
MYKFTGFALICLLLLASLSFSQPSPSIVAEPVVYSEALYYNHTSHIARTSTGDLFAIWTSSGTDGQIVYSQYDDVFQFWSPPVAISTNPSGGNAHKAGIAADDNGNLYVVWQQRNTTAEDWAIYFSKYDGSSWSAPVNLTGNNYENEEAAIEVSDQGTIFVAWNTDSEPDSSEWILCLNSTDGGATWNGPDTLSSADGIIGGSSIEAGRPFLARGNGGKMVCTWFEVPDGVTDEEIFINYYDGSQWTGEQQVTEFSNNNNRYPTAAVDGSDNVYVIYRPLNPRMSLVMKKKGWSEPTWQADADTVVGQGYSAYKPFLGIDDNDGLYVVFRADMVGDTTGLEQINYVTSADGGATWSAQQRLSREWHDGGYVTLATRIRSTGVDVLWREGYRPLQEDPDSISIVYGHIDLVTNIGDPPAQITKDFRLEQNYPNPFNPSTLIKYRIARRGDYELAVFNLVGQKIRTLINTHVLEGEHQVTWDGRNDEGIQVPSGIYFYRLKGKDLNLTRKMMLIR